MFTSNVSRRGIARTLSGLVALTLTVGVGGLSANGAAADAGVPDAPLNLTARDIADGTVGVFWDAPLDGGSEITDYRVVLSFPDGALDDGGDFPEYTSGAAPDGATRDAAFVAMPFDQGDYVVAVSAINASGEGPAASTGAQSMVHSTVSDAPQDVAATSPDTDTVVVTWTPPAFDGGQPIDGYDVSLGAASQSTDGDGRAVTYNGLAAGTYTARVTAHNSNGSSASSAALVTVEGAWSALDPPTHLHASRVTKGGVTTITWTAPKAPVGIYLMAVDGRFLVVGPHKTAKTVRGLRAGPAKVKLVALDEYGFSKTGVIPIHVKKSVAQAPKPTLRLGMSGPAVERLQVNMGMRHHNGRFGKSTRAAVLEFQEWFDFKRTGEVNDRMRYLLHV